MENPVIKTHKTLLAAMLLSVVATQIFYIAVVSGSENADTLRMLVWTWEAIAFSLAAVSAFVLTARSPVAAGAFAAIALGSATNVIQVGMGLAEFGPARGSEDGAVFGTVIAGAFFLYFHGKALFGLAAIILGAMSFRNMGGAAKIVGVLAALAGLASVAINIYAMANGMGAENANVQPAGAAGTAATFFLGLLLLLLPAQTRD